MNVDVAVVGAGPAGSAAAVTLANAGMRVALIDKATFPRDKCCGDGLTTGALRILEQLGVSPLELPSWKGVDAAWVRSPSGRVVELPLPSGRGVYAAVVRRAELDALLVDRARDAGAEVHEGAALTAARSVGDTIELDTAGLGTITAGMAIGADGMWSPLRKMLGVAEPGYLGEWHAFRQYFAEVGPAAASQLWVWFERDLLPGYAWSFPLGGRASQRRLRHPPRRSHLHPGHEGAVARPARAPHVARRARRRSPRRGAAQGVAHPGEDRITRAHCRARALRRRRGRRDRSADRRGNRPSAAHRHARGRRHPRARVI